MKNNMAYDELISVVIPVYNVEKYIEKCIKSIVAQTYKNLEIIIVNDGTKDNSIQVIKKYIDQDDRIQVITQENAGLSEARNTGIRNASGKYIVFVDSDDYIDENMIEKMYRKLKEDNSQMVVCNILRVNDQYEEIDFIENYYGEKEVFNNDEAIRALLLNDINGYAWNKLYDINLFKDIRYIKGILFEDIFTTFDVVLKAEKVSMLKDKLYCYVKRGNSITQAMNKKSIVDLNYRVEYISERIDKNQYLIEYSKFAFFVYLMSIDWVFNYQHDHKEAVNDPDFIKIIDQKEDLKRLKIFSNENVTKKEKFKYILMRTGLLNGAYKLKYMLK